MKNTLMVKKGRGITISFGEQKNIINLHTKSKRPTAKEPNHEYKLELSRERRFASASFSSIQ